MSMPNRFEKERMELQPIVFVIGLSGASVDVTPLLVIVFNMRIEL